MTASIKPGLHNVGTPSQEDRATATGYLHKKIGNVRPCGFRVMQSGGHTKKDKKRYRTAKQ